MSCEPDIMNEFNDPFKGGSGVYQFTMSHLEHGTLFRKDADYAFGVNSLAIATTLFDIRLLAYTLMSNHLHLLLYGTLKECRCMWRWIIYRFSVMLSAEYGIIGLMHEKDCNVSPVTNQQMFLNELAYILRNCYRARICSPYEYRWSSADVYFNPYMNLVHGEAVGKIKQERRRELFKSHVKLPPEWETVNSCVLNRYFVDYKLVEKKAGDSLALFDRLRVFDLESGVRISHGLPESIRFSDSQLQEKIASICKNEYYVESPHQLDRKTLLQLARTLARRFAASKGQIRRLIGLTDEVLEKVL